MDPITVRIELSQREFVAALGRLYRRSRVVVAMSVIGPALLVLGIVTSDETLIVIGFAVTVGVAWLWLLAPRQQWRRSPHMMDSQRYTFDDRGVIAVTARSRAEITWEHYANVVQTDRFYTFMDASSVGCVVPQRTFDEPDSEARVRRIVGQRREAGTLKANIEYVAPSAPSP